MLRAYLPRPPVQWHWLEIAGPDARDYLHRVTTVDVNGLEPGQGAPGCLLTALGKMRAWFWLWRLEKDRFGFELDGGASGKWLTLFREAIEQLHFAEKFELSEPPGLASRWFFSEGATELPFSLSAGQTTAEGGLRLFHHGRTDFGHPWVSAWGTSSTWDLSNVWGSSETPTKLAATDLPFLELERWRIDAVRPRVETEIDENSVPLEVGLLDAIGTNKGCYPGQEVIERTISLGAPARRLALIELEGGKAPIPGEALLLVGPTGEAGPEIGRITSVSENHFLAQVRKMHAKENLTVKPASETSGKGRIVALSAFAPAT